MPPENVITGWSRRSPQVDHLEHLAHPLRDHAGVDAVQLGVQAQVLLGGEVAVQAGVLEDQADVAAHVVALADDVEAADPRGARGRPTSVQSILIVVLLPAPLGPRKPKTSPRGTVNDTPRTASTSP